MSDTVAIGARVLLYGGALIAIGNVGVSWIAGDAWSARLMPVGRARVFYGWCAMLTALVLLFLAQFVALELSATAADVAMLVRQTAWGHGWTTLVLCSVFGVVTAVSRAPLWMRLIAAVSISIAMGGLGHAAADDAAPLYSRAVDALHVLCMGFWIGTLLLLDATPTDAQWKRFGDLAKYAAPVVVLTGIAASWRRLYGNSLSAITSSQYGQALLWKVGVVFCILALGALHRRHIGRGKQPTKFTVKTELLLAALVLVITAVLTGLAPPGE